MVKLPTEDEQYFAYRDEIQFHLDLFNKYAEYLYLSNKPAPTGIQFVLSYQAEDPQRMVCIIPNRSPVLVTYPRYRNGGIPSNGAIEDVLTNGPKAPSIKNFNTYRAKLFLVLTSLSAIALWWVGLWEIAVGLWIGSCVLIVVAAKYEAEIDTSTVPTFTVEDLTEACLGQARSLEELKLFCPTVKLMSQSIIRYIRENVSKEYHETMQLPPREISEIKKDSQWNPFT